MHKIKKKKKNVQFHNIALRKTHSRCCLALLQLSSTKVVIYVQSLPKSTDHATEKK